MDETVSVDRMPRLSYLIARLDRLLRAEMAIALDPHGLSVPQYTVLSVLRSRSGLSNAQLARRSYVTPQAMHQILTSLDTAGLVVREESEDHKRIRLARLTAGGLELLARCDDVVDALEDQAFSNLSSSDRRVLRTLVERTVAPDPRAHRVRVSPDDHST